MKRLISWALATTIAGCGDSQGGQGGQGGATSASSATTTGSSSSVSTSASGSTTAVSGSSSAGTGGAPVGDLCAAYPSTLNVDLPWGNGQTVTTGALGGFVYDAVVVGKIIVPSSAVPGPNVGGINVAEYQGPPTYRTTSLSLYPCDFRGVDNGFPTDSTGAAHPLAWAFGNTATANFIVGPSAGPYIGLIPGQTYYFNVRNYSHDLAANTCSSMTRCDAILAINPPMN